MKTGKLNLKDNYISWKEIDLYGGECEERASLKYLESSFFKLNDGDIVDFELDKDRKNVVRIICDFGSDIHYKRDEIIRNSFKEYFLNK